MTISKRDWKKYIERLRKINEKAAERVADYMGRIDISTPEGMSDLLDYSYAVATYYGEGATELACQMYDAVAAASRASVPAAEPAPTATYGEVAKAVRGKMFDTKDPSAVGAAVGRLVKMAGVDTTMQNALRDGAEWAWIPSGDTCVFCLTLASRGWQTASKKAIRNGHAEHIHNNCDCTYQIRFNENMQVEGYDPDALYDEYMAAGDTRDERINALRRKNYAANKDKINAQKRAAYFKREGSGEERLRRVHFGQTQSFEHGTGTINAKAIKNAGNDIYVSNEVALTRREAREADRLIATAKNLHKAENECNIPFVIVDDRGGNLASYNPRTNIVFISKDILDNQKLLDLQKGFACPDNPNSTLTHELFHWKDAESYRQSGNIIDDAGPLSDYSLAERTNAIKGLREAGVDISDGKEIRDISDYAYKNWLVNNFEEVYTEFRTKELLE